MELIIKLGLSYLIGSTSGSILLGKLKGVDIRNLGSGNAGGTNAFRTVGPLFALCVITIDVLKGVLAVLIITTTTTMMMMMIVTWGDNQRRTPRGGSAPP